MRNVCLMKTVGGLAALAVTGASLPAGTRVHFATCTLPGVEHGCVVADSGGALYNVTGARPGILPFQWLQGTGTIVSKMSFCQQGQIINDFVPDERQAPVACVQRNRQRGRG